MTRQSADERNVIRSAILAINDGLLSNFNLVMAIAGSGVSKHMILLSGLAGIISGAFSMAQGEYLSTEAALSATCKPQRAAVSAFAGFGIGATIPLVPFFFLTGWDAIIISANLSATALFAAGISSNKKTPIKAGLKQVLFGLAVATLTYILGMVFGVQVGG